MNDRWRKFLPPPAVLSVAEAFANVEATESIWEFDPPKLSPVGAHLLSLESKSTGTRRLL